MNIMVMVHIRSSIAFINYTKLFLYTTLYKSDLLSKTYHKMHKNIEMYQIYIYIYTKQRIITMKC